MACRLTFNQIAAASWSTEIMRHTQEGQRYVMSFGLKDGNARRVAAIFWDHAAKAPSAFWSAPMPADAGLKSATPKLPAMHWDERELADLYGIRLSHHPDPRRLLLPDTMTQAPCNPKTHIAPWTPRILSDPDMVHVGVGPVHAGIIESGQFHFSVIGETVLQLDARLGWNHRGVEFRLEGVDPWQAGRIVSRVCGSCSVSHQVAFAEAVEAIAGWSAPSSVTARRLVLGELERMANHIHDLAQLATGVALQVAFQEGLAFKDEILRLAERHFGHRYLFDTCFPGGAAELQDPAGMVKSLDTLERQLTPWLRRLFAHQGFRDRLSGTGVVPRHVAEMLGAVGPAARACGIDHDLRRDLPYGHYLEKVPRVRLRQAGDAMARAEVRVDEIKSTLWLLKNTLHGFADLDRGGPTFQTPTMGAAVGWAESPRGATFHFLAISDGRISRCHIRSSSFVNWPLIMVAATDQPIGDFPLINKSFELCYACSDR